MAIFKLNVSTKTRKKVDQQQRKMLSDLYEEAYREAQEEIAKWSTQNTATASLQTWRLKQLTSQLSTIYQNVYRDVEKQIITDMTTVSQSVIVDTEEFFSAVHLKIGESYANVPVEAVNSIRLGEVYQGDWTLSKAIWGDYSVVRNDIETIIAKDLALNKGSLEIAKDLEKFVNPNAAKPWDWGKVYPGVRTKIDYNAQRLARTLVSHAYQKSIMESAKKNPFAQGVKWLASNSHRTCQLCHDRAENDSYGLGAGVFPADELPLDHPNGMCSYSVVLTGTLSECGDRVVDWVNGATDEELERYLAENNIAI